MPEPRLTEEEINGVERAIARSMPDWTNALQALSQVRGDLGNTERLYTDLVHRAANVERERDAAREQVRRLREEVAMLRGVLREHHPDCPALAVSGEQEAK